MMTDSPPFHDLDRPWTVDDLMELTDIAGRMEILDGSLLVTPPPDIFHSRAATQLERLLARQAPRGVFVGQGAGFTIRDGRTYYVPDIYVAKEAAFVPGRKAFSANDMLLVVEVLSEYDKRNDLVLKRGDYALAGIPAYWIIDRMGGTVTLLELGDDEKYQEQAVLRPGERWKSERPFPLTLDPAEFL
jgi:Uma2 family endonuclease